MSVLADAGFCQEAPQIPVFSDKTCFFVGYHICIYTELYIYIYMEIVFPGDVSRWRITMMGAIKW